MSVSARRPKMASAQTAASGRGLLVLLLALQEQAQAFYLPRTGTCTAPRRRRAHVLATSPIEKLPDLRAAVIVPGFLNDDRDFLPLAELLTQRGLPTTVVPLPLWAWLPTIGGRSLRPIIERIDHAVRHVSAMGEAAEKSVQLQVPPVSYGIGDLLYDFRNNPGGPAKVGGSSDPDEYPLVEPRGMFPEAGEPKGRVALIGHSAGGFISRIYMSQRAYAGKNRKRMRVLRAQAYFGERFVHSLVTLGTPHKAGSALPFVHVAWANKEPLPPSVRVLAIGATGSPGDSSGSLTLGSYSFCTIDGKGGELLDGDGMTTTAASVSLAGAETLVLDSVTHYPWTAAPLADLVAPELTRAYRAGKPWYGTESVIDNWLPWLTQPFREKIMQSHE